MYELEKAKKKYKKKKTEWKYKEDEWEITKQKVNHKDESKVILADEFVLYI